MDERVAWVVQELKSRLVELGYILYLHYAESGSVYITIDLGLGPRIRVSNHDIVYTEGVDLNIQPGYLKGSKPVSIRLRKSVSVVEKVIAFTAQYIDGVKYNIACEKYNKLVEHRHLSKDTRYDDLLEICGMFAKREYKNMVCARKEKSKKNMKKFKNQIYFYK